MEKILAAAIPLGRNDIVEILLNDGTSFNSGFGSAIRRAILFESPAVEKMLAHRDITAADLKIALSTAVDNGKVKYVKLLLADSRTNVANYILKSAISTGNFEIFRLLLNDKRNTPSSFCQLVSRAIYYEQNEMIKLLLADPRVDPTENGHYAIKVARQWEFTDELELLITNPRITIKNNPLFPLFNAAIKI